MIDNLLNRFVETYNINPKLTVEGRKDAAFELLSCVVVFTRSPYYAKDHCWNSEYKEDRYVLKNDDGKIDGYDIKSNLEEIIIQLVQAKNSTSISTSDIREFFSSVNNYVINLENVLPPEFQGLQDLRNRIGKEKEKHPDASLKYELFLVCRGITDTTKTSLKTSFNQNFNRGDNADFKIVTEPEINNKILTIKQNIRSEVYEDVQYNISFDLVTSVKEYSKSKVVLGAISAGSCHHIIEKEFEKNLDLTRLFSGNVRGFLGDTKVNEEIKKTIESAAVTFLSKNNGAVIVCDSLSLSGKSVTVKNPIIINGQQTFASIYKYATKTNQKRKIQVPVKLISIDGVKDEIIEDIAKASNQANEITELDLLANKKITKKLKKYFNDKGDYLKVKDGELLNDILLKDDKVYDFGELLKIWLSVYLGRPNDAKFTKKNFVLFNDAYKKTDKKNKKAALVKDSNFDRLAETFYESKNIYDSLDHINNLFGDEPYYEHANYFILYLIREIFGDIYSSLNSDQATEIKGIIQHQIIEARKSKESEGKEFTFNNYFKSAKPISDYLGYEVEPITDKIEDFFKEVYNNDMS